MPFLGARRLQTTQKISGSDTVVSVVIRVVDCNSGSRDFFEHSDQGGHDFRVQRCSSS